MKKILLIIILAFISLGFADSYSGTVDFEDDLGSGSAVHFGTRVLFEVDPTCTVEGIVLSGDPCDGSARVCVGTNITIEPSTAVGRWAVGGNLNVLSNYPYCAFGGYCPTMAAYSTKTERDIEWIDDTLYDEYDVGGGGAEYAGTSIYFDDGIPRYSELGGSSGFDTQAVDYRRSLSEPIFTNQRGYANVFCKGTYEVRVGGMTISRRDMGDGPRAVTVPLRSEGTANLRVSLNDIDCFAGVVKHPIDLDHPEWFGLYLYGYDTPTIRNLIEDSRIEVVDIQPELTIRSLDVDSYVGSTYLLRINVENTGDVRVRATRVWPICTGSCGARIPSITDCIHFGFCPSSTGFGTYIAPGATQDLYVVYTGALAGDIIEITYESPDEVCSDTAEWPLIVNIPDDNVTRCEIEPSSNIVTPYEVHEYTVTCYNSLGSVIPCSGNNWYWDSMSGGFVERTSSYAYAYTADSLSDVSGRIAYETGGVICTADVLSDNDGSGDDPFVFTCDLTPDSVSMDVGEFQYFDLDCTEQYRGVTNFVFPTSVDYAMVSGLAGALSDETVRGVNFTATVDNVTGDVEAMSWYTHPDDGSLVGYIDWSDVTVGMGGEGGNETDDGGDDDEDEYEDCEIDPSDITRYPGWDGSVTVSCGSPPAFGSPCSDVVWSIDSEIGYIDDFTDDYAHYVVDEDATLGDSGEIWARVNAGTPDEGLCHADILIAEPECVEFS